MDYSKLLQTGAAVVAILGGIASLTKRGRNKWKKV